MELVTANLFKETAMLSWIFLSAWTIEMSVCNPNTMTNGFKEPCIVVTEVEDPVPFTYPTKWGMMRGKGETCRNRGKFENGKCVLRYLTVKQ
jgi:hypothetical protein